MRTIALLALGLGSQACLIRPVSVDHDDLVFPDEVDVVRVDAGSGNIEVVLHDGEEVEVDRTLRYTGEPPTLSAELHKGVLELVVDCRTFQQRCSVDHVVRLPRSAHIDIDVGSGDVFVDGMVADVVIGTGSGNVDVRHLTGDLTVGTGSGDVLGVDLAVTSVLADTGSGDVSLDLVTKPLSVWADTGSGDVRLELPSCTYQVNANTGSGDVRLDGIVTDRHSDRSIDIDTGSGDVVVVGR